MVSPLMRPARPDLEGVVEALWASREPGAMPVAGDRERVLPTGAMHLVFRLSGPPVRLFEDLDDERGTTIGRAVVGGARSVFYLRDTPGPVISVGAQLRPGAAALLFGAPAGELAGRHTPLESLWGRAAEEALGRLCEATSAGGRLEVLESLIAERLRSAQRLHPAVAHALARFGSLAAVRDVVREAGCSHRRFILLFRRAVGLPPKVYCRVLRLQRALGRLAASRAEALSEVSVSAGYCDQAHFCREFRRLTGVSPAAYRALAPPSPHHVPVGSLRRPGAGVNSVQDGRPRPA